MAIAHACTIAMVHAYAVGIVDASTLGIVHACTMTIVLHVLCPYSKAPTTRDSLARYRIGEPAAPQIALLPRGAEGASRSPGGGLDERVLGFSVIYNY